MYIQCTGQSIPSRYVFVFVLNPVSACPWQFCKDVCMDKRTAGSKYIRFYPNGSLVLCAGRCTFCLVLRCIFRNSLSFIRYKMVWHCGRDWLCWECCAPHALPKDAIAQRFSPLPSRRHPHFRVNHLSFLPGQPLISIYHMYLATPIRIKLEHCVILPCILGSLYPHMSVGS